MKDTGKKMSGDHSSQPMGKLAIESSSDISSFVDRDREWGIPVPMTPTNRPLEQKEIKG